MPTFQETWLAQEEARQKAIQSNNIGGNLWWASIIAQNKGLPFPTNEAEATAIIKGYPINWAGNGLGPTPNPTPTPGPAPSPAPYTPPGGGGGTPYTPPATPYVPPIVGGGPPVPGGGGGGTPVNTGPYEQIASMLPGYGLQQNLGSNQHGFGIPGFENTPQAAGGSWAGTTFQPNGPTTLVQNPIPESDVTNPQSPFYRPIYGNNGEVQEGFKINPAVPYQTTWNLQTYNGKPAPFINIHEQIGKAFEGVPEIGRASCRERVCMLV